MEPQNASEIRIATACPADIAERDWPALVQVLDPAERAHSARFVYQTDRRAYVLAHAMRRLLIAGELGAAHGALHFSEDERGKPLLGDAPEATREKLYFSHSHTRLGVACAVTRLAPVGIDVEPIDVARADPELLARYVAKDAATTAGADFFQCWTALEAFWKAAGTGLAEGNPRIRLEHQAQRALVRFEGGGDTACGVVLVPRPLPGCAIAVALRMPFTGEPVITNMHCRSAFELMQLSQAMRREDRFAAA